MAFKPIYFAATAALLVSGIAVSQAQSADASALAPERAAAVQVTATTGMVSEYMFRGQRLGGASWEPAVELQTQGLTAGVWSNLPADHFLRATSNAEVDVYSYFNYRLTPTFSLLPGATLYEYPGATVLRGNYRSAFEPNLAANLQFGGVRYTPAIYYDIRRQGLTGELTAAKALPVVQLGTELDLTAVVGTSHERDAVNHSATDMRRGREYWSVGASVPYQIFRARLTLGLAYASGSGGYLQTDGTRRQADPVVGHRVVVSLSAAYGW